MAVNPTKAQIERLVSHREEERGEVVMLNLLKFRERAEGGEGGSGADSYGRYAAEAVQKVEERGGQVVWMGRADSVIIGDDEEDAWDAVVLVMYPDRAAFLDMIGDPEYQEANVNREGGLERMKLIAMTPGAGFERTGRG